MLRLLADRAHELQEKRSWSEGLDFRVTGESKLHELPDPRDLAVLLKLLDSPDPSEGLHAWWFVLPASKTYSVEACAERHLTESALKQLVRRLARYGGGARPKVGSLLGRVDQRAVVEHALYGVQFTRGGWVKFLAATDAGAKALAVVLSERLLSAAFVVLFVTLSQRLMQLRRARKLNLRKRPEAREGFRLAEDFLEAATLKANAALLDNSLVQFVGGHIEEIHGGFDQIKL